MFGMLESIAKAAVGVVVAPVAVVADVVTLGGVTTGRPNTYTGDTLRDIMNNLEDAIDPDR